MQEVRALPPIPHCLAEKFELESKEFISSEYYMVHFVAIIHTPS